MSKLKNIKIYVYGIILLIIDQIIKLSIMNNIPKMSITVINNVLKFTYCENKGVAFSLGNGNVMVFIVLNIIIICGLILFYENNKQHFNKFAKLSFIMVIAGGGSNLLDRIFRGYVVDFIDINELFHFAIFNVADMFIVIGICGIAIWALTYKK